MPRRHRLLPLLFSLALLGVAACAAPASPPERLVLIVVDTLRRDYVSAYGGGTPRTPNIDALAARGQKFENALAAYHQTSMSMGSLVTGRTPSLEWIQDHPLFWNSASWCGMARFARADEEGCIPQSLPTLAERLRDAGYWTIGVVSNQFLYEPGGFSQGFDDWVEVGEVPAKTGALARLSIREPAESRDWLQVNRAATEAINRRSSDEFFLYLHYMDVHDYRHRGVSYAQGVATVDQGIGRLLDKLEKVGLLDGAVVFLTSDHGERLGERHAIEGTVGHLGDPTFMEHLAVPLVVAPPVVSPERLRDVIRTPDLHDLILEVAGAPVEPHADLRPGELFVGELRYRSYVDGAFKSTTHRKNGTLMLFDLQESPGERTDVSDRHPEVVEAHRRRIEELTEALSARRAVAEKLSDEDRARLRALGYLDEEDG